MSNFTNLGNKIIKAKKNLDKKLQALEDDFGLDKIDQDFAEIPKERWKKEHGPSLPSFSVYLPLEDSKLLRIAVLEDTLYVSIPGSSFSIQRSSSYIKNFYDQLRGGK